MPAQIAKWDSVRDVWTDENRIDLFSELSDAYLETFPTSGMTLNGVAYELPTWEHRTDASGSSSSPDSETLEYLGTPTSRMWKGAGPSGGATQIRNKARGLIEAQVMDIPSMPLLPTVATSETTGPGSGPNKTGGDNLRTVVSLLPTPKASDGEKGGPNQRGSSGDWPLPAISHLLPTPVAQPSGNKPEEHLRKKPGREVVTDLAIIAENDLLPTGGRMSLPSGAGRTDSEGQLHGQLSLLDVMVESDSAHASPNG